MRFVRLVACAQMACGFIAACAGGAAFAAAPASIDFGRDVQPILRAHCYDCHGPDEQKNASGSIAAAMQCGAAPAR